LTELSGQKSYNEIVWILSSARDALNGIFTYRPLHFSAGAASALYKLLVNIVPEDFGDMVAKIDQENPVMVSYWEISQIKQATDAFATALKTECAVMDAYYVVKKGAFSTKDLVENAHCHIPLPSRNSIPRVTKDDFDQAGKCLAFDVYTAAAFHLLRGTEAVLREYYQLVVPGPKRAGTKMRNWGVYIKLLRDYGGAPKIIQVVDHLRDAYRNPVTHPEEQFTEESVLILFGLCVSAVALLQSEINNLNNQSATLQFPAPAIAVGGNP
jgi:hypothetical protein